MSSAQIEHISLRLIYGNPDQPRQTFDPDALRDLADSIAAQGLIQPITVTPRGDGYMIVAGERRFRAHGLLGCESIPCLVQDMDDRTVMLQAIIENAMRRDVNLIEEAVAYQRCLTMGLTVDELAKQLGVAPFRIKWRVSLLQLRDEYQALARSGQISAEQALEMSKLDSRDQDRLFDDIRAGRVKTSLELKSRRADLEAESSQLDAFGFTDEIPESTKRLAQGFEATVRRVTALLTASAVDNQVVAVKRINPDRAQSLADLFAAMRGDILRIETALRNASAN
jgi:ParB family chromosome partitioning protein